VWSARPRWVQVAVGLLGRWVGHVQLLPVRPSQGVAGHARKWLHQHTDHQAFRGAGCHLTMPCCPFCLDVGALQQDSRSWSSFGFRVKPQVFQPTRELYCERLLLVVRGPAHRHCQAVACWSAGAISIGARTVPMPTTSRWPSWFTSRTPSRIVTAFRRVVEELSVGCRGRQRHVFRWQASFLHRAPGMGSTSSRGRLGASIGEGVLPGDFSSGAEFVPVVALSGCVGLHGLLVCRLRPRLCMASVTNVFVWIAAEAPSWLLKDLISFQAVYNKTSNTTERCITSLRQSMVASQTNRTEGRCVSVR
jgi:hypothetical protein